MIFFKCVSVICFLFVLFSWKKIDSGEDAQEEFGWKLVHGDVFRPPRKGMLLSVFVGSGVQVLAMTIITLGKLSVICERYAFPFNFS